MTLVSYRNKFSVMLSACFYVWWFVNQSVNVSKICHRGTSIWEHIHRQIHTFLPMHGTDWSVIHRFSHSIHFISESRCYPGAWYICMRPLKASMLHTPEKTKISGVAHTGGKAVAQAHSLLNMKICVRHPHSTLCTHDGPSCKESFACSLHFVGHQADQAENTNMLEIHVH